MAKIKTVLDIEVEPREIYSLVKFVARDHPDVLAEWICDITSWDGAFDSEIEPAFDSANEKISFKSTLKTGK